MSRFGTCAVAVVLALVGLGSQLAAAGVVIHELMYHPLEDRDDLQFVEIHNAGADPVDLAGWRLSKGVRFDFPAGARLEAGGFLVVCADEGAFRAVYGSNVVVAGVFSGRLRHGSETVELSRPGGGVVDAVKYADAPPWPVAPDGYGSSLERICAEGPSFDPANWEGSKPSGSVRGGTPGAPNDTRRARTPPRITCVTHGPVRPGHPLVVQARVQDEAGVERAILMWWSWQGSDRGWREVEMERREGDARDGVWSGALPVLLEGDLVRYAVRGRSSDGMERRYPAGSEPRSSLFVHTFKATNASRVPLLRVLTCGKVESPRLGRYQVEPRRRRGAMVAEVPAPEWRAAAVWVPAGGGALQVLDHVRVRARHGGYKVHFRRDEPLDGMTGINVLFEDLPRRVMSEHLAYDLYRKAGVPSPASGHLRLELDGKPQGYQLWVEQVNGAFLRRHDRQPEGNLYKVLWYGQGLEEQHEKKTNPHTGHGDLKALVEGLRRGDDAARWALIQEQFNVEELASYFAVNMCIQNWDGFFNNYYAHHDPRPGGRWEVYPWDLDKTWGDFDGAWNKYRWHEMPLTMGMDGDSPPWAFFSGGPHGGPAWWRAPGCFSGPMLANPAFRGRFLDRLRELCDTVFTPERMGAAVNGMAHRLEEEVRFRAQLQGRDVEGDMIEFRRNIESFHWQIRERRAFILGELRKVGK